jgi:regulatory protein
VNRKKLKLNEKDADGATLRAILLRLLARRDHSYQELVNKLTVRGYTAAMIYKLLDAFKEKGMVDDARFAAQYVSARFHRGFGIKRIINELKLRGIDEAIIAEHTKIADNDCLAEMQRLLAKRMKNKSMQEVKQKAKLIRFFLNRGFTKTQIFTLLGSIETE